ncbi:hypothetical protein H1R20_g5582, partial [Candolleomyces eurysporus]
MKFSATFAVLAVLAIKTFVSAVSVFPDDMDLLEMRDDTISGKMNDIWAREVYDDILELIERQIDDGDSDSLLAARQMARILRVPKSEFSKIMEGAKNIGEGLLQTKMENRMRENEANARLQGPRPRPQLQPAA